MLLKINILCLSLFLLFALRSFGQEEVKVDFDEFKQGSEGFSEAKKNVKSGEKSLSNNDIQGVMDALNYFLAAYGYNPNNPELNYKIGVCYLQSRTKAKSLEYLEKAYKAKKTVAADINIHLGKAYQYNLKFDEAIAEYLKFMKTPYGPENKTVIDGKIAECKVGKELMKNPQRIFVDNIRAINSIYDDYCPVVTADESELFFTSRRLGPSGDKKDKLDGKYYEDIYVAHYENRQWQEAVNVGPSISTKDHDATVGISPDGQSMLIYRKGDLYISYLAGDQWTKPVKLPGAINTDDNENSACFSPDGNSIYFVRGRSHDPNVVSNGDIYVCRKVKGEWTEGKSLGKPINTPLDEDGVFMHADGKTLYFSSKGHKGLGGFDIYKSVLKNNGTWSEPENLGIPINTPDDDIYFVLSASGRRAYYSTVREDGMGETDIYLLTLLGPEKTLFLSNEDNLMASITNPMKEVSIEKNVEIKTIRLTVVKGTITDKETMLPLEASIDIIDNEKNQILTTLKSNSKTGRYLLTLPSGKNYGIPVRAENYLFHSENFDIPATTDYQEITKDIALVTYSVGSKVVLRNIFFDYNKSTLRPESESELERLKKLLDDLPNLKIEISGHTDNHGTHDFNIQLSNDRSKAVVDYLISKGIASNRLKYRGAAYDEPIATNTTDEGRQLNRRVEFKVLSNQ